MGNKKVLLQARGITRSKERIREENELIILIAAEKVFAKHGLKGSTTKQIADMPNFQNPIFIIIFILN